MTQHHVILGRARFTQGFTLIELLAVLAIIAVLAALAVPGFRELAANQALSNTVSDLMSSTLQARSTALATNQRTIVQPISASDWRTGWRVYVDVNGNGSYDAGTDRLVTTHEPLAVDIAIGTLAGTGENRSITVIGFGGDGFLATVGGSADGSVMLQSTYTSRTKYLIMSRVGRAQICDPKNAPGCTPSG